MAGKKKEVSLQASITIQEQWDEMLAIKGLTVVDVYQQWCGPCKAVVSLLRKIKNELGDELLHFATAEADSMEALEKYRGRCEPTFLFYGGGQLVGVLRGANAPLLQRTVLDQLAREKLVEDEGLEEEEEEEEEGQEDISQLQQDESMLAPTSEGCTLAIIKPDAVAHGNAGEIITKIRDAGFQILAQEERSLGEQVVRELYRHKEAEPYFEELVQFMCSGPSHLLVLSRDGGGAGAPGVVQAWLDLVGPSDVEEAKRDKPHSLRARFGGRPPRDALHGSADGLRAAAETALLFPAFRRAGGAGRGRQEGRAERTLALLRPPAARDRREELLSRVSAAGFRVELRREVTMTGEEVRRFYHRHGDEDLPPALQLTMTSGPALVLVLSREDAVQRWRDLLGPADVARAREENPSCLRAVFAMETGDLNQLHGSASAEEAQRETHFFFPAQRTLAFITPDALQEHREEVLEEIRRAGFSVVQQKEELLSRELAEDLFQEQRDQPFFSPLLEVLCGGPCLMLVLRKENAVEDWRALMGPADPAEARGTAPGTLRARFSSDLLHNAVQGSSSEEHAEEQILRLFGDSDPGLSGPAAGDPPEAEEPVADAEGRVSGPRPPSVCDGAKAPDQQETGEEHLDPGPTATDDPGIPATDS